MIPRKPPIAEPKTTPTRDGSNPFSAASSLASTAAASASRTFRSSRRASFVLTSPAGSKSLTSAATRTGKPLASNDLMKSIPLSPATAARQVEGASLPSGVTAPRPVTATRFIAASLVVRMPGKNVPFPPMEAELVEELPTGDWQYEPKWDGFRGVLENDGGELALWSRNERPLLRYFPELEPLGKLLPPHSALDGEIVIAKKGQLDFDSMQLRLHPAESRIRKLSAEIPAQFIAFDILLWKGEKLHKLPLEKRRRELERKAKRFQLSPYSRDLDDAERWLDRLEAAGLDGVVAKRLGAAVPAGIPRGRRQGQEVQDGRLRDRRLPLQREGGGPDLDAAARAVRQGRRARLRRTLLGDERRGSQAGRGGAAEAARRRGSSATSASPVGRAAGRRARSSTGTR